MDSTTGIDGQLDSFRLARRDIEASVLPPPVRPVRFGKTYSLGVILERLHAISALFRQGEGLIAGKISPQPALLRFGARISEEGGGDVPATWARPR